jgi:pimeloyl-ACP methyl ester carboxylesterase
MTVQLNEAQLIVYTYRPACRNPSLLIVLHGMLRNAESYMNAARPLADQHCFLVAAPLFDKERFPGWRYQGGGISERHRLEHPSRWTGNLVVELAERMRALEGRKIPYSLIGHSAGGQLLSRLAAFVPTEAQRIVIANPSTYVWPALDVHAPFGLGGVQLAPGGGRRHWPQCPRDVCIAERLAGLDQRNQWLRRCEHRHSGQMTTRHASSKGNVQ